MKNLTGDVTNIYTRVSDGRDAHNYEVGAIKMDELQPRDDEEGEYGACILMCGGPPRVLIPNPRSSEMDTQINAVFEWNFEVDIWYIEHVLEASELEASKSEASIDPFVNQKAREKLMRFSHEDRDTAYRFRRRFLKWLEKQKGQRG